MIENLLWTIKEFKSIAMHTFETDQGFKAMIYLAAAVIRS
tara:strand:- start:111 stop:230 length:120 start_codon:yes stop_codon:yes gene_type:complete